MKKRCIALLLAAVMLLSPGASTLAETTGQASVASTETEALLSEADELLSEETSSETETATDATEITLAGETEVPEEISGGNASSDSYADSDDDDSDDDNNDSDDDDFDNDDSDTDDSDNDDSDDNDTDDSDTDDSDTDDSDDNDSDDNDSNEPETETESEAVVTEYTVNFNANGGSGTTKALTVSEGNTATLTANKFSRTGYTFLGWSLTKSGDVKWKNKASFDPSKVDWNGGTSITLFAIWEKNTYKITYKLNKGTNHKSNPSSYTVTSKDITLKNPTRTGYTFDGWYTDKSFKKASKVTTIKKGSTGNLTLYAKWTATSYKITYKLNSGKNNSSNPKTYTIETKTITLKAPTRSGYGFAGWYTSKDFKANTKVTTIKKGSTKNITLYAKWEKEYSATSTSAKITSCSATGKNTIKVKASISKRVKSSDSYYYLVTIDPNTGKILKSVAKTDKASSISFKLDTSKDRGYALAKYAIAVKSNGKYVKISNTTDYITNPEKLAAYTTAYQLGTTKKGIQTGVDVTQSKEVGSSNAFINIPVSKILSGGEEYVYNGKTYKFGDSGYSSYISEYNKAGINVTVQILLDADAYNMDSSLVAKEARQSGHPYYTWNTKDKAAREKMEALFCYLAEKWGTDSCYVSNWILGNEVNADYAYNWRGSMSDNAYIASYAYTFRSLYNAVRSVRSSSRTFICLDDMWCHNNTGGGITGKKFLTTFVSKLNGIQKNVNWNVAYHPYTPQITNPAFWSTSSSYNRSDLVTSSADSPFITMKNINVLTNYVKNTYGDSHRIIISEIGFNSSSSQTKQAAALAYAYNIAATNSMIDAFIIRSYEDSAGEAAAGLNFGIKGRAAYNVFKYMDTKKAEKYTNKYVSTCGGSKWSDLISGYATKKLYSNNGKK